MPGMPLLIAFILFTIFDLLNFNTLRIRDFSLILSCVFLFRIDNSGTIVDEGVIQKTGKRRKGINTFMWIENEVLGNCVGCFRPCAFVF